MNPESPRVPAICKQNDMLRKTKGLLDKALTDKYVQWDSVTQLETWSDLYQTLYKKLMI
jgi:hypothetical protein